MDLQRFLSPQALLWALVGVFIVVLLVSASTSTAAFSVYNSAWDGASGVQSTATQAGVETRVALSTNAYADVTPNETVAVIIGPDQNQPYTPSERTQVRRFLENGGTLVVADDFGGGNQLLAGLGAQSRLDGRLLRDPRSYGVSTAMPIVSVVANGSVLAPSEAVMLNHGTAIATTNGTVIARSSEFSYLDGDRDDEIDAVESLQPYPVAVREDIGAGQLILVSDGSLFINAMLNQPETDNAAFIDALIAGKTLVLIDGTHTSSVPLLHAMLLTVRSSTLLQALLLAVLGGIGYTAPRLYQYSRRL